MGCDLRRRSVNAPTLQHRIHQPRRNACRQIGTSLQNRLYHGDELRRRDALQRVAGSAGLQSLQDDVFLFGDRQHDDLHAWPAGMDFPCGGYPAAGHGDVDQGEVRLQRRGEADGVAGFPEILRCVM